MELELQKYLRSGYTPGHLKEEYGIKCKTSCVYPELHLFKYSMIDSPLGKKIVQESRGIILNKEDNWNIVCRPYEKFFNYNEGHAATIDWNTARVYEKLDGSLLNLYFYNGSWRVASSGDPDANGQIYSAGSNITLFNYVFWFVWNKLGYFLPTDSEDGKCPLVYYKADDYWKDFTFMFELTTPINKIVVQHKLSNIVLHGVKNNKTGEELFIEPVANLFKWKCAQRYSFYDLQNVVLSSLQLNPIKQEGYVIQDADFNRIKVKSPQYITLHHFRSSFSIKNLVNIIRTNEKEEFLAYFPEYTEIYNQVKDAYNSLFDELNNAKEELNKFDSEDYRGMALSIKGKFYQGFLMGCIRKNKSVKSGLQELNVEKLLDWLNLEVSKCI